MTKKIVSQDSVGKTFERLTVLREYMEPRKTVPALIRRWECACTCGATVYVFAADVKRGHVQSCGCLRRERTTVHGLHKTPEYNVWAQMIQRTTNTAGTSYANYGGRGVRICERWRKSFEVFYKDMGPRPSASFSINRIDNDGNYEPDNCHWATPKEQSRNTRQNRRITFAGKSKCIAEWASDLNVSWFCLFHRIFIAGWPIDKALTASSQRRSRIKAR